jgi:hypothetical protein
MPAHDLRPARSERRFQAKLWEITPGQTGGVRLGMTNDRGSRAGAPSAQGTGPRLAWCPIIKCRTWQDALRLASAAQRGPIRLAAVHAAPACTRVDLTLRLPDSSAIVLSGVVLSIVGSNEGSQAGRQSAMAELDVHDKIIAQLTNEARIEQHEAVTPAPEPIMPPPRPAPRPTPAPAPPPHANAASSGNGSNGSNGSSSSSSSSSGGSGDEAGTTYSYVRPKKK